jgi:hypothetical protein
MNRITENLKSILISLASILSKVFRRTTQTGNTTLNAIRNIVIFGSTAVVGVAIFIYVLLIATLSETRNHGVNFAN